MAIGATGVRRRDHRTRTNPTAHGRCSNQWSLPQTTDAVNSTQPTAISMMGRKYFLKPRQLMPTPEKYRSGGNNSSKTSSGSSLTAGKSRREGQRGTDHDQQYGLRNPHAARRETGECGHRDHRKGDP